MGYTVPKGDFDRRLKPALEKAGLKITSEIRGDERNISDIAGALYPGESVLTDFVYFDSNDDGRAKAEIDRLGIRHYAPESGEDSIGSGPGFHPGGCIFLLILIAMAAAAFLR